jgi:hypothetical protein
MPPKTPANLPDIIFVSDDRAGALFHHTKIDDIADLLVDHIKSKVFFETFPDELPEDSSPWIYQFAMIQIECEPSLKFMKKGFVYHPGLLMSFLQTFLSTLSEPIFEIPLSELPSKLPSLILTMKHELKQVLGNHIEELFES